MAGTTDNETLMLDAIAHMVIDGKSGTINVFKNASVTDPEDEWAQCCLQAIVMALGNEDAVFHAIDTNLRLLYISLGGGRAADIILADRLKEIFPENVAYQLMKRFQQEIDKQGIREHLERVARMSLAIKVSKFFSNAFMAQTGQNNPAALNNVPKKKNTPPSITVLCPRCKARKVIRPSETKMFRCKKSAKGCGYESVYPIPGVTLERV